MDANIQTGKTSENNGKEKQKKSKDDLFANRQPISEVLHDIYDRK